MAEIKKPVVKTTVRMLCILSGKHRSWGVGSRVEMEPAEAKRLIDLGAAEAVSEK